MARSRTSSSVASVPDQSTDYETDVTTVSTETIETTAGDPVQDAKNQASAAAEGVMDSARTTVTEQANLQKERAADSVSQLADAIQQVSGNLQGQEPIVAGVADTAAEQAQRIAAYLREKDVNQIIRSGEDFARQQPLLFYGGAFVLGLALARFLKAGDSSGQAADGPGVRYSSGGTTSTSAVDTRTGLTVGG